MVGAERTPNATARQAIIDLRPSERVGEVLDRIRREASSEAEKGRWFEHLFMATVRDNPEFDVADIWPWRDWPDRERLTGLDGRDHGIDLVAKQADGTVVAVQCKCYAEDAVVAKPQLDSFLNESARPEAFGLRWIVSTCRWNSAAERAIDGRAPRVARIDFLDFLDHEIREFQKPTELRHPDWGERLARELTISSNPAISDLDDSGADFISRLTDGPSLDGIETERDRSPMRKLAL